MASSVEVEMSIHLWERQDRSVREVCEQTFDANVNAPSLTEFTAYPDSIPQRSVELVLVGRTGVEEREAAHGEDTCRLAAREVPLSFEANIVREVTVDPDDATDDSVGESRREVMSEADAEAGRGPCRNTESKHLLLEPYGRPSPLRHDHLTGANGAGDRCKEKKANGAFADSSQHLMRP